MKRRNVSWVGVALLPALLGVGCSSDTQTNPDTTPPLAPLLTGATFDDGIVGAWWEPNTEPDLAGYYLYVIEAGVTRPVNLTPSTNNYIVMELGGNAGLVEVYVTAIDFSGNESSPSDSRRANDDLLNQHRDVVNENPRDF